MENNDRNSVKQAIFADLVQFLSMWSQEGLQKISENYASIGRKIEMCLNRLALSGHRNFPTLLANLFGNNVDPDSAEFKSAIGLLDERVELDKNIKPGDKRYLVALSTMASKIAYENQKFITKTVENQWQMTLLGQGAYDFWNDYQHKLTTQGFLFHDKNTNMIFVTFRGTEPFDSNSWASDVDIPFFPTRMGDVHVGFLKALGLQKDKTWQLKNGHNKYQGPTAYHTIRDELKRAFENDDQTRFIVTGHSLGGALAVLFPAVLSWQDEEIILSRLQAVYTFGQPRVGDSKFADSMDKLFERLRVKYYRFVYSHDIVPRLPFEGKILRFKHFGKCIHYNTLYEAEILKEEPDKNYFSLKSFVPKILDALWEIERSFILPYMFGPYYKESCLLRMVRVVGLIAPCLVAHGPQEYINAVQLGNDDVFV